MKYSKAFWFILAGAVLLFAVHASADYLLQAYQHGWATWLDLHGRAAQWPWYLDVLPRDLWHGVQFIRNNSVIAATILTGLAAAIAPAIKTSNDWWEWAIIIVAPFVFYALTRAVFFSLVKELLN